MVDEPGAHVPVALPELGPLEEKEEDDLPLEDEPSSAADEPEPRVDLDDSVAEDLDPGVHVDEPTDEGDSDEAGDLVAPLDGGLFAVAPDTDADEDDAGVGDVELDLGGDVEPSAGSSDPEGAVDGSLEALVEGELPELDDGTDDSDGALDPASLELEGAARDEPRPPPAPVPWTSAALAAGAPLLAVAATTRGVVGAGRSVVWLPARDPEPHPPTAPLESLAVGADDTLLATTTTGELVRLARGGDRFEAVPLRATAAGVDHVAQVVAVAQWWPLVLARTSAGEVFASRDGGQRFAPLELRARVIELCAAESAVVALAEDRAGRTLLRTVDAGAEWRSVPLDEWARQVGGGPAPLLAAAGPVVALADPERGLAVSGDGGVTFRRVAGCAAVTALAASHGADGGRVWAALRDELEGRSWLVEVDAERAVAHVVAATGAAITSLAWGEAEGVVHSAGLDGLHAWRPPAAR